MSALAVALHKDELVILVKALESWRDAVPQEEVTSTQWHTSAQLVDLFTEMLALYARQGY